MCVNGWITAPAAMRALAMTQLAPTCAPSPSDTRALEHAVDVDLHVVRAFQPAAQVEARRVGQAHARLHQSRAWRSWNARSSSASWIGLFTPSTCSWSGALTAATSAPSFTASSTMSVR